MLKFFVFLSSILCLVVSGEEYKQLFGLSQMSLDWYQCQYWKISKEDSLLDCGVFCSISGKKSINSASDMILKRKQRQDEVFLGPSI